MKKNIGFLCVVIVFCASMVDNLCAMNPQEIPNRLRAIAIDLKAKGTLSTLQIDRLITLRQHFALDEQQKEDLDSIITNILLGKSEPGYTIRLENLALFFEQWAQLQIQEGAPLAPDVNLICLDGSSDDDRPTAPSVGTKREFFILDESDSDQEPQPKQRKLETPEHSDEEDLFMVQKEDLRCNLCLGKYTQTASVEKSISCCEEYHLFCNDCLNGLKNKKICPKPGCGKQIDDQGTCYTNSSDQENYDFLQVLLASCTHKEDAVKKQVLQFLLKKSLHERNIPSDLQLSDSDSDSDSSEEVITAKHRNICSHCKNVIIAESVIPACSCPVPYHRECFDLRTNKQCPKCLEVVDFIYPK